MLFRYGTIYEQKKNTAPHKLQYSNRDLAQCAGQGWKKPRFFVPKIFGF